MPDMLQAGPDLPFLYRSMVLIRTFEESVRRLAAAGAIPGLVHLCSGQEASNVGICAALETRDVIASHHRGHGHCLARGADPTGLLAEILGRVNGLGLGRSGSMHVIDPEHGNLGTNGIVGGGIPLAAGAALAFRTRGEDRVAVAFFGDGALNQGLLHECMNMAAIWELPVVFVCENNGYGEFTAMEDVTAGSDLRSRGEVFGIPSRMVDGMDVLKVFAEAQNAVARARAGEGPSFVICNTWRYGGHHVGDKQTYKETAEAEAWKLRDPILRLAGHMIETGISREVLDAIDSAVNERVAQALSVARASPEPEPVLLEGHVYAG